MNENTRISKSHQGLLTNRPVQGYTGHLLGQFIWDRDLSDRFLVLRKCFECGGKLPERAWLYVTAAQKYQVFVNGEYVGRGPCRSVHPSWIRYDTYDITGRLRSGANSIVVLAYDHGRAFYFSPHAFKGVFVQAELFDGDVATVVATDGTWRVKQPERFRRDTHMVNYYTDIKTEIVEADKDPGDWVKTEFDDSAWPVAVVRQTGPEYNAWPLNDYVHFLEPRPTPMLREQALIPKSVVQSGELDPASASHYGEIDVAERLWYANYLPLQQAVIANTDDLIDKVTGTGALFQSYAGKDGAVRDPFVVLDFGRPVIGMPEIEFDVPAQTVVEIAYAARLQEGRLDFYDANAPAWGPWKNADRYVAQEGRQIWRLFEPRGAIRYVQIVFRTGGKPAQLLAARLIALEYPVEERGRFDCSDATLTRVWHAAVDTVHLAMEDVLSCDSVRERSYYVLGGELEQHHLSMYAAYGDVAITEAHFTDTSRHQGADGTSPVVMIARVNPIKNYSLYYPMAVWRRHLYFGKQGFLETQYLTVASLMAWFEQQSDTDGLLYNLPYSVWLDWTDMESRGANLEVNALFYKALLDAAQIATRVARPEDAERWRNHAQKLRNSIRRQHWDEATGCFRDSVIEGLQAKQITETSNAFTLLFGIASSEQAVRVVGNLVAWSKLPAAPDSDSGMRKMATLLEDGTKVSRTTPLYFWYVLDALLQVGRDSEAWAYMSANYGRVFNGSGPYFLTESWPTPMAVGESVHFCSSIHGGGAGVAFLLSSAVLGVRPLEPGFARCRIEPRLGVLAWAKGTVPTPFGDVRVSWEQPVEGGLHFEIEIPDNMPTELVLPRPDGRVDLIINGRTIVVGDQPSQPDIRFEGATLCVPLSGGVCRGELRKNMGASNDNK